MHLRGLRVYDELSPLDFGAIAVVIGGSNHEAVLPVGYHLAAVASAVPAELIRHFNTLLHRNDPVNDPLEPLVLGPVVLVLDLSDDTVLFAVDQKPPGANVPLVLNRKSEGEIVLSSVVVRGDVIDPLAFVPHGYFRGLSVSNTERSLDPHSSGEYALVQRGHRGVSVHLASLPPLLLDKPALSRDAARDSNRNANRRREAAELQLILEELPCVDAPAAVE